MTSEELGVRYFNDRIAYIAAQGLPLTTEAIALHVTGAISAAVDAERDRCANIAYQAADCSVDGTAELRNVGSTILEQPATVRNAS